MYIKATHAYCVAHKNKLNLGIPAYARVENLQKQLSATAQTIYQLLGSSNNGWLDFNGSVVCCIYSRAWLQLA